MNWVYGFQCHNFIKIGVASHMARRRKELQAGNPIKLKLVLRVECLNGAYYLERRIHQLLAEYAIGREWFSATIEHARAAVAQAKIDLEAKHVSQVGWEFACAERDERKKAEREARRLARGEIERAALWKGRGLVENHDARY